jgi:hypothetical protein
MLRHLGVLSDLLVPAVLQAMCGVVFEYLPWTRNSDMRMVIEQVPPSIMLGGPMAGERTEGFQRAIFTEDEPERVLYNTMDPMYIYGAVLYPDKPEAEWPKDGDGFYVRERWKIIGGYRQAKYKKIDASKIKLSS